MIKLLFSRKTRWLRTSLLRLHASSFNFFLLGIFCFSISVPSAKAEDENHGVLAGGVVHNIASDRKIEKIGGILQPEPLDIYLKRLFEEFSKKMDRMDERLQNIERAVRQEGRLPAASLTPSAEAAQRK